MGPRGVIFIGPSAPPAMRACPRLDVRPPARRGDVRRAVEEGYQVIGLVDGELYQTLAVTPEEVREAARRARVFGAASLGALRACECPGVEGVGEIHAAFRAGTLAAEDEVVGTYDPETGRTVAWPMVVVREAVGLLGLGAEEAGRVLAEIGRMPFDARTEGELARRVPVDRGRWREALRAEPNVKQRDAAELLERVIAMLEGG
jgi:ribosomal protein S12 methylthiotransferase accessory factor